MVEAWSSCTAPGRSLNNRTGSYSKAVSNGHVQLVFRSTLRYKGLKHLWAGAFGVQLAGLRFGAS